MLYFGTEHKYIRITTWKELGELCEWCNDTLGPQYELWEVRHDERMYFKREEDYMLAVLRWKQ